MKRRRSGTEHDGIECDDVAYILDTFAVVRKNEEKAHGEYRTKRLILETYDAMAEATHTGTAYVSPLGPPILHLPRAVVHEAEATMVATLIHIDEEFETEWPRGSLYALNPPHDGEAHVLLSTCVINNVPECCIFAALPDGTVKSWAEMRGSQKGTLDFEKVLTDLGYRIEVAP